MTGITYGKISVQGVQVRINRSREGKQSIPSQWTNSAPRNQN